MGVKNLTSATFIENVGDYKNKGADWKFKGDKPCLVDFYTTWCVYCKSLSPILDELAIEFEGKIDFYKIDMDKEEELEEAYSIRTVPTLLLCKLNGSTKQMLGTVTKIELTKIIEDELLG